MNKENKTEITDPFKDWTEKDHLLELHRLYEEWNRTEWSYSDYRIEELMNAEFDPHFRALTTKYGYTGNFREKAKQAYLQEKEKDKDNLEPDLDLE